jgi:hypothetical protein
MAELQPIMPSTDPATGDPIVPPQETPEPVPITDREVGDYREQDRFLPVSPLSDMTNQSSLFKRRADRQCRTNHEGLRPTERQDCQRR